MDTNINIRTQTQYGKVTDRDREKNPETSLFGRNNANPVASKWWLVLLSSTVMSSFFLIWILSPRVSKIGKAMHRIYNLNHIKLKLYWNFFLSLWFIQEIASLEQLIETVMLKLQRLNTAIITLWQYTINWFYFIEFLSDFFIF